HLAPTLSPSDGSGRPEGNVWILCSSLASAIYDASWLSMSAISTAGGHTGRLVNAHLVRRRSLPGVKSAAKSLLRQYSVGCITATILLHDHPDGHFVPLQDCWTPQSIVAYSRSRCRVRLDRAAK